MIKYVSALTVSIVNLIIHRGLGVKRAQTSQIAKNKTMDTKEKKNKDQLFFYTPVQRAKWTLVRKKKWNKASESVEETEELVPKLIKALPRVTIAGLIVGDEIKFGFATCGRQDQFRKSIGRSVAMGRIKAGKEVITVPIVNKEEVATLFVTSAKSLAEQIIKDMTPRKEFEAIPV